MNIETKIDDYGFRKITLTTVNGGKISITDFGKEENTDIGSLAMMNEHGLGGSNYIRNVDDIEKHIRSIKNVVWIGDWQKYQLISFLKQMRGDEDYIICPSCNITAFEEPMGALSRKDNETMICPECGTKEAIEEFQNQ